ncbi:hypothetical protein VOLCADRAFT_96455 [Volvox carteri f. nagariensis]|uniref:Cyclic nucleotide-binding domain-containing protein n=1 Tax=Volvox carteri f. nagariensis TaxID=3068 RepID=D8UA56_VOLCA|nr:uncharacterized protein VOLCADRAFT_96455 [Volvox carteri f. nagariensis]EFJ43367.1 hypothetical protein VOLCADRAFT_96455 [Volvox carteri f. nagariensis]|eukprot:XP_002955514.1 hypothetical protein VOLCADRAFT_96455 [Volvox carteri f. nagariensis]
MMLIIGAVIYALIVSNMAVLAANLNALSSRYKVKASVVADALRYMAAPQQFRDLVYLPPPHRTPFFPHPTPPPTHDYTLRTQTDALLAELPRGLLEDIKWCLFSDPFLRLPLFAGCDEPFMAALQGAVLLRSLQGDLHRLVLPGEAFSELALLPDQAARKQTVTAVAGRATDLVVLAGRDLAAACREHPQSGALVQERLMQLLEDRVQGTEWTWFIEKVLVPYQLYGDSYEQPRYCGSGSGVGAANSRTRRRRSLLLRLLTFMRCDIFANVIDRMMGGPGGVSGNGRDAAGGGSLKVRMHEIAPQAGGPHAGRGGQACDSVTAAAAGSTVSRRGTTNQRGDAPDDGAGVGNQYDNGGYGNRGDGGAGMYDADGSGQLVMRLDGEAAVGTSLPRAAAAAASSTAVRRLRRSEGSNLPARWLTAVQSIKRSDGDGADGGDKDRTSSSSTATVRAFLPDGAVDDPFAIPSFVLHRSRSRTAARPSSGFSGGGGGGSCSGGGESVRRHVGKFGHDTSDSGMAPAPSRPYHLLDIANVASSYSYDGGGGSTGCDRCNGPWPSAFTSQALPSSSGRIDLRAQLEMAIMLLGTVFGLDLDLESKGKIHCGGSTPAATATTAAHSDLPAQYPHGSHGAASCGGAGSSANGAAAAPATEGDGSGAAGMAEALLSQPASRRVLLSLADAVVRREGAAAVPAVQELLQRHGSTVRAAAAEQIGRVLSCVAEGVEAVEQSAQAPAPSLSPATSATSPSVAAAAAAAAAAPVRALSGCGRDPGILSPLASAAAPAAGYSNAARRRSLDAAGFSWLQQERRESTQLAASGRSGSGAISADTGADGAVPDAPALPPPASTAAAAAAATTTTAATGYSARERERRRSLRNSQVGPSGGGAAETPGVHGGGAATTTETNVNNPSSANGNTAFNVPTGVPPTRISHSQSPVLGQGQIRGNRFRRASLVLFQAGLLTEAAAGGSTLGTAAGAADVSCSSSISPQQPASSLAAAWQRRSSHIAVLDDRVVQDGAVTATTSSAAAAAAAGGGGGGGGGGRYLISPSSAGLAPSERPGARRMTTARRLSASQVAQSYPYFLISELSKSAAMPSALERSLSNGAALISPSGRPNSSGTQQADSRLCMMAGYGGGDTSVHGAPSRRGSGYSGGGDTSVHGPGSCRGSGMYGFGGGGDTSAHGPAISRQGSRYPSHPDSRRAGGGDDSRAASRRGSQSSPAWAEDTCDSGAESCGGGGDDAAEPRKRDRSQPPGRG